MQLQLAAAAFLSLSLPEQSKIESESIWALYKYEKNIEIREGNLGEIAKCANVIKLFIHNLTVFVFYDKMSKGMTWPLQILQSLSTFCTPHFYYFTRIWFHNCYPEWNF